MFEQLLNLDSTLLVLINSWHTDFLDGFMWNVSQKFTWLPLYVSLLIYLIIVYRDDNTPPVRSWLRIVIIVAAVGICFGLSDFVSGLIKHAVERPRPAHEPALEGILHIVNGYRGGQFGFVSAHAANTFSIALLFSLVVRNWRTTLPLMLWTALNCYSRMYLAVHYPGDILGGLVLGGLIAFLLYLGLIKSGIIKRIPAQRVGICWFDYIIMMVFALTCIVICFY